MVKDAIEGVAREVAAFLVAFALVGATAPCSARAALGRGADAQTGASTPAARKSRPRPPRLSTPADPAVADLTRQLETGDDNARESAVYALGVLESRSVAAVPHMLEAVARANQKSPAERERDIPYIANAAVMALMRIGPPAVPQLIEGLGHRDALAQWVAASALEHIEPAPVEAAAALGRAIPRAFATEDESLLSWPMVNALGRLGAAAVPALLDLLKSEQPGVPMAAMRLAEKLGPVAKSAVPALIAVLSQGNEYERESAIQALGSIGPDARAAVPLLERTLKEDRHPQNHHLAKTALQRIQASTP
jgi:HEAT repeat protein